MALRKAVLAPRRYVKKITTLILLVSLILVIYDGIRFHSYHAKTATHYTLAWMYNHDALVLGLHILFMILFTSFFVPPALLVLASGFILQTIHMQEGGGFVIAWMASMLGATIGGSIAFAKTPRMSHELLEVLIERYPILSVVDAAIVRNPLRVMMLLRLNPLLPFGVLNYVFAMKRVELVLFVVSMASVMQWYLLLTCIGACFSNMYNGYGYTGYAITAACLVVAMSVLWRIAKRELMVEIVDAEGRSKPLTSKLGRSKSSRSRSTSRSPGRSRSTSRSPGRHSSRSRSPGRNKSRSRSRSRSRGRSVASEGRNRNVVESNDLSGTDYVRMQIFGQGTDYVGRTTYRNKLDLPEIVLDNFS